MFCNVSVLQKPPFPLQAFFSILLKFGFIQRSCCSLPFGIKGIMLLLIPLVCSLVTLAVLTHYECLRLISHFISGGDGIPRHKLLFVLFGALAAHIVEIAIFAVGYWFADVTLHVGNFAGIYVLHATDYFYFSAEAYTSLGVGNLYPVGDLRLLAGMETLNGLLLIGWSTSYTFLAMTRYWDPK